MSDRATVLANRSRSRLIYVAPESREDGGGKSGFFESPVWAAQPAVDTPRLEGSIPGLDARVPAYWVKPKRSTAEWPEIQPAADRWLGSKYGDTEQAAFLATGIVRQLDYDSRRLRESRSKVVIVPVPLDPAKRDAQQDHRTLALAKEVKRLAGASWPIREDLYLTEPFSKRELANQDVSRADIRRRLEEISALSKEGRADNATTHVLLVDDVITHGSTMKVHASTLRRRYPRAKIIGVAAAQMTVREALGDATIPPTGGASASLENGVRLSSLRLRSLRHAPAGGISRFPVRIPSYCVGVPVRNGSCWRVGGVPRSSLRPWNVSGAGPASAGVGGAVIEPETGPPAASVLLQEPRQSHVHGLRPLKRGQPMQCGGS